MSEYWKSTPKYWCKFCKTFVRDTGLEKKAHESTPKHQSNIQRSLRDLHKTTEREEREKQRAKDEVARLNGIVSGKKGGPSGGPGFVPGSAAAPPAKATADERKRQMAQLAAMGIAVPQEPRPELSDGGGWSTVSETPVYTNVKAEDEDGKPVASFGVRKRKLDEDEEEIQAIERKGWGSKFKSYPGSSAAGEDDLDALLSRPIVKKETKEKEEASLQVKQENEESTPQVKKEADTDTPEPTVTEPKDAAPVVKKEEPNSEASLDAIPDVGQPAAPVKQEEPTVDPPVVFKKRKGKR